MHHLPDPARVANIDERIVVEENKVRPLSHLDGAEIFIHLRVAPGSGVVTADLQAARAGSKRRLTAPASPGSRDDEYLQSLADEGMMRKAS
jgi:hypothetical protein